MEVANSAGISLPPSFDAVGRARRFAVRHLHEWGCEELGDDARLIVSELVTNMVRHAPHGGYLKLMLSADRVRITMTDHGDGTISAREPSPHESSGRGLLIVERLASAWGVDDGPDARGHTVWCDLVHRPADRSRRDGVDGARSSGPPRARNDARAAPARAARLQGVVDATPVAAPPMELNGG